MPSTPRRAERNDFLVFGRPLIGEEEMAEVQATLESGWIGTGPRVARFEEDFKTYLGASQAVAMNSCTAALHIAMVASGIGPDDEVVTTPMTFAASANAIVHSGATPVFADCDRETMNIDPESVRLKITPRTRAILPVHFGGRPCDMDALTEIADEHDLLVIEDCAHAIETTYHGRHAGTIGDIGCFSFYVTKNVVTGEGGMLVTEDDEFASRAKTLALHGMTRDAWRRFSDSGYRHYQVVEAGFKYNMMDLQAALGLHQLARVDETHARRREIWQRYDEAFAGLPMKTPLPPDEDTTHGYHLYTVQVDIDALGRSRDWVLDALTALKIGVGVHYVSLHLQPFYQRTLGCSAEDFPNALHVSDRTISLPLSAQLSDEDVEDVVHAVRQVLTA